MLSPSCSPGLARHLLPPKNHRGEFLRGPSISKPAAEGRLIFLPLLLQQLLVQPMPSTFSPKRPFSTTNAVMDEGPEQGTGPGGSLCPLAWEPGSEESGLGLQLVLRRVGILVGHSSQTRGLQVTADQGSSTVG